MRRYLISTAVMLLTFTMPILSQKKYKTETHIDWETGNFSRAIGYATYPVDEVANMAQAKLLAKRGAEVEARAELARILEGFHIGGGTTVEKMVATNKKIAESFKAFLKGVVVVSSEVIMEEGSPVGKAVVEIALTGDEGFLGRMYALSPGILDEEPVPSSPETVLDEIQSFDGLIIDARELSIRPDLNILIKSRQGTIAYSRNSLDPDSRLSELTARYCKSEEMASSLLGKKGCSNPLTIIPQFVDNGVEFIVTPEDAMKILSLHEKTDALKKARVIVITG